MEGRDTVQVTIKNVSVSGCNVTAVRRAGGLVGFIGGITWEDGTVHKLKGDVTITGCEVSGTTINSDATGTSQNGYAVSGGIVGFVNKDDAALTVTISNCTVKDSFLNAYRNGAILGDAMNAGCSVVITGCTVTNVKTSTGAAAPTVVRTTENGTVTVDGTAVAGNSSY